jgi:hypothetical protein
MKLFYFVFTTMLLVGMLGVVPRDPRGLNETQPATFTTAPSATVTPMGWVASPTPTLSLTLTPIVGESKHVVTGFVLPTSGLGSTPMPTVHTSPPLH